MNRLVVIGGCAVWYRGDDQTMLFAKGPNRGHEQGRQGDIAVGDQNAEFACPNEGGGRVGSFLIVAEHLDAQGIGERGAQLRHEGSETEKLLFDGRPVFLPEADKFLGRMACSEQFVGNRPGKHGEKRSVSVGMLVGEFGANLFEKDHLDQAYAFAKGG